MDGAAIRGAAQSCTVAPNAPTPALATVPVRNLSSSVSCPRMDDHPPTPSSIRRLAAELWALLSDSANLAAAASSACPLPGALE